MGHLEIDPMNDIGSWVVFEPDGVTPSTELSLTAETALVRFGADGTSGRLEASALAAGHWAQRALPGLDLTSRDELRLWIHSSRATGETGLLPFFLELKLAGPALSFSDPANTWHRYLPVSRPNSWELVRLGLAGLDPAVRSNVSGMRLRCVHAEPPFVCTIDDVLAVTEEMIGDVEAALRERLHHVVSIGGSAVPAEIHVPDAGAAPAAPYIRILQLAVRYSGSRTQAARPVGDFSSDGHVLRPPSVAYELTYQLDVVADDRPAQTLLLEAILREMGPHGKLLVNGAELPYRWIAVRPRWLVGGARTDRVAVHYTIATRQERGPSTPVRPVTRYDVDVDARA